MKKITFILLFAAFFVTGCASKLITTESTISSESSTINSSSISSSLPTSASSEIITEQNSTESASPVIDTEEKAIQRIVTTQNFENNDDIDFISWGKIENDFLFKAQSKSISAQGGSGTVGFYRVTLDGQVTLTDSQGNQ